MERTSSTEAYENKANTSVGGIAGWLQVSFGSGLHQSRHANFWRGHPLVGVLHLICEVK
jgi:hypothetical protein